MDFQSLCDDYGIQYWTSGWKFCTRGWIQVECPFCEGSTGPHLGFNTFKHFFKCWRCGWHSTPKVLVTLIGGSYADLEGIRARYRVKGSLVLSDLPGRTDTLCQLPKGHTKLKKPHRKFLKGRGFADPKELAATWGLRATGEFGDYKFRIIAPVFFEGKLATFQGRDWTNKQELKYKACRKDGEAIEHQSLLYGWSQLPSLRKAIVCEGIIDVWKIGPGAVGTWGIDFSQSQVRLLSNIDERFILFDSGESQAWKQAKKLARVLRKYPGRTVLVDLETGGDPGDLSEESARKVRQELLGY